jgi:hypothetical protein
MENFDDGITFPNITYKIQIDQDSPFLIGTPTMSLHVIKTVGGSVTLDYYKPISHNTAFTYTTSNDANIVWSYSFIFKYQVPSSTPLSQTQLTKFEIRKLNGFIWDWQSTFYYYVSTTCEDSWNFNTGTINAGDHEVSDYITASVQAFPNGGITELDAGLAVTLLPGFYSNLSMSGQVLIVIDGCGGAYRTFNPALGAPKVTDATILNFKNENISIYPNPANDMISLSIPKATIGEFIKIEIRDVNGRLLHSENKTYDSNASANLNTLTPGLYFITISGTDLNYNQKIVKQ